MRRAASGSPGQSPRGAEPNPRPSGSREGRFLAIVGLAVLTFVLVLAASGRGGAALIIPALLLAAAALSATAALSLRAKAAEARRVAEVVEKALRRLAEAASGAEPTEIFGRLAESLAKSVDCRWAAIGRLSPCGRFVRTLAFWDRDHLAPAAEHALAGTPGESVAQGSICKCESGVADRFPEDRTLREMGAIGYMGHPLRDSSGQAVGILTALHDAPLVTPSSGLALFEVTVRRAEAELARLLATECLAESEEKHRVLLDNLVDGVVTIDRHGTVLGANAAAGRLFGWPCEEMAGLNVMGFMPKSYRARHSDGLESYLDAGVGRMVGKGVLEVEGLRRDGGVFPMELSVARFESTGDVCFTGTFRDITERKRAEEELKTSRRFFEDSLDSLTAHIAILDEKGTIQYVNRAWRRFAEAHGLPRASCGPGKNYLEVCEASAKDSEEAAEMAVGIRSVMSGVMDEFVIEYPLSGPFGSRWFTASVTRFRSPGPVRVMIAHEDITQRKRGERALVRAKDAALAAANAKSEFLANMSHEVRTPMNGILGFVEILLDSEISGEQREHLETIRLSSESLLTVINDILDFSKVDAGKIDLEVIPFDLGELLDGVTHLMAPPAIEKGLLLTRRVSPERSWRFLGDPTRLRQVLLNLVGNAIKFTDSGAVTLGGDVEERAEGLFLLRLSVRDTGIGIPAEQRDRLFQPFSQVDGSTTRRFGGTGLGLTISKRLVELMGGRIDVRSEQGIGTTFTVTLALEEALEQPNFPPQPAERAPSGVSRRPGARSLHILLAEDNAVNQKVALALLGRAGHTVEVARDGRECVEAAARGEHDLILMDVQMPAMDGLAATAAIRAREAGTRRVPIIAITARAMTGDREQCLEAGMDDYVTKPIRPKELLDTIDKWAETLGRHSPHGVSSGAPTTATEGTARTASLDSRRGAR